MIAGLLILLSVTKRNEYPIECGITGALDSIGELLRFLSRWVQNGWCGRTTVATVGSGPDDSNQQNVYLPRVIQDLGESGTVAPNSQQSSLFVQIPA